MKRLFFAVAVSEDVRDRAENLIRALAESGADVSWVKKEKMHITLQFLGSLEEDKVKILERILKQTVIGLGPFSVSFEGLGTFPLQGAPRVIWVGIGEGGDKLVQAAGRLGELLKEENFRVEERSFSPHLTLGRVRSSKNRGALEKALSEHKEIALGKTQVGKMMLMESSPSGSGSVYSTVFEAGL